MPILASTPLRPFTEPTQPSNNAIFLCGHELTSPPSNNGILQKYNSAGTTQFISLFSDRVEDVAVHTDGSYCVALRGVNSNVVLQKYNPNDTLHWSINLANTQGLECVFDDLGRIYFTYAANNAINVRRYSGNGLVELTINNILGSRLAVDRFYNILIGYNGGFRKYNSNGVLLYEIIENNMEVRSIATDRDANIYVASVIGNNVRKYDIDGNLLWSLRHGSPGTSTRVNGIYVNNNSDVYITGDREGTSNTTTKKFDNQGNLLWGAPGGDTPWGAANNIVASNDNFVYIVQGTTEVGIQLRKLNAITGALVWSRRLNTTGSWFAQSLDVQYKA